MIPFKTIAFMTCAIIGIAFADTTPSSMDIAEAKQRGVPVTQVQIEYLQKDNAELRHKILLLQSENADLKEKINAGASSAGTTKSDSPSAGNAGAATPKILHPVLDQPKNLNTLYARLAKSGAASVGFISNPIRVGSAGLVESVLPTKILDKNSMVAAIRFPELKGVDMAPGGDYSNMRPGQYANTPKAWQTSDAQVLLENIDTANLIDNHIFYLTEPIKITGTRQVDGTTIFVASAK